MTDDRICEHLRQALELQRCLTDDIHEDCPQHWSASLRVINRIADALQILTSRAAAK